MHDQIDHFPLIQRHRRKHAKPRCVVRPRMAKISPSEEVFGKSHVRPCKNHRIFYIKEKEKNQNANLMPMAKPQSQIPKTEQTTAAMQNRVCFSSRRWDININACSRPRICYALDHFVVTLKPMHTPNSDARSDQTNSKSTKTQKGPDHPVSPNTALMNERNVPHLAYTCCPSVMNFFF